MKLAAVNPRPEFNFDNFLNKEVGWISFLHAFHQVLDISSWMWITPADFGSETRIALSSNCPLELFSFSHLYPCVCGYDAEYREYGWKCADDDANPVSGDDLDGSRSTARRLYLRRASIPASDVATTGSSWLLQLGLQNNGNCVWCLLKTIFKHASACVTPGLPRSIQRSCLTGTAILRNTSLLLAGLIQ